jgi:hypothetical protein
MRDRWLGRRGNDSDASPVSSGRKRFLLLTPFAVLSVACGQAALASPLVADYLIKEVTSLDWGSGGNDRVFGYNSSPVSQPLLFFGRVALDDDLETRKAVRIR